MTSRTGSLTIFNGEAKEEGPALCFVTRGEPDVARGESGGVLPPGNMEGNPLLEEIFTLLEFPVVLKGGPTFASASKDFTYVITAQKITHLEKRIH